MNIDDLVYVRGNDRVTSGLSLRNIGWALLSLRYAACWMPLTWLSYMTDVTLFGPNDPAWKRPLGKRHAVVRRHVECAPCLAARCAMRIMFHSAAASSR